MFLTALLLASCRMDSEAAEPIDVTTASAPVSASVQTQEPATATEVTGRVVGVHDGDTITVYRPDHPEMKIRMAEIDAPELGQPFGQASKQMLSRMVFGTMVRVRVEDVDRYGRHVARVYTETGQDVNRQMIRDGGAWVYRDYNREPALMAVEDEARTAERGLWDASLVRDRVEPWLWRRGQRPASNDNAPLAPSQSRPMPVSGCSKTRCSQMTTCEEARHHLTVCRVQTLDGDRDGTPCEALCS